MWKLLFEHRYNPEENTEHSSSFETEQAAKDVVKWINLSIILQDLPWNVTIVETL